MTTPPPADSKSPVSRILLALVCLASLIPTLRAQAPSLSPEKRKQFEATVSRFMAANSAPGVSAAIVKDGAELWSGGFGMADLENFVPATSHTLYRLASVSKSLTATGAMELWESGKLDLDAPVQKYCSAFPPKEGTITTREVLGHLAGIRHYRTESQDDPEAGNVKHFDDPIAGGLAFFAKDPLVSPPGKEFHYSTHGYTVVGCAMEGASGQKYVDYMKASVFTRAHMTETQPDDQTAIIPLRTRFYAKQKDRVVNAGLLDSSYKIPGGGWLSSADDMAQFEIAILNDTLLRRSTRDIMWTPQKAADGTENGYALGWGWGSGKKNGLGFADVGHDGGQQGTSTVIMIAPERNIGIVVLINMEDLDATALATELMKMVISKN
jgi:serine beta-lactamase-like protein LACTB